MLIGAKEGGACEKERHLAYGEDAGAETPAVRTATRKRTNPKMKEKSNPRGPRIPALAEFRRTRGSTMFQTGAPLPPRLG